jgi:uncharacterized protein (TIGR02099 family)
VRGVIRKLWRAFAVIFAAVVILLAVLIGLVRLALVQVPEYRNQIQGWASDALGWPVEIEVMDARLGLRGPEFRFSNARVLTHDRERTVMRAAGGGLQLDTLALLKGQLRPGTVSLAGVALRVERSDKGRWRLLGEEGPVLGEDRGSARKLEELPAIRLRLEDLRLEIEDLQREVGPWQFLVAMLDVRLEEGELIVSAEGILPEELGSTTSLSLVIHGQDERGRPSEWSAGISTSAFNLQAFGDIFGPREWAPSAGLVDGHLSIEVDEAGVRRLVGDLLARELQLPERVGSQSTPALVPYRRLGATFEWMRTPDGWTARATNLEVQGSGSRWQSLGAGASFAAGPRGRRYALQADLLQLEDFLPLSPWLPPRVGAVVDSLAPSGIVRDLDLELDLPASEAEEPDLRLAARFETISLRPASPIPGVHQASGTVAGDGRKGTALIDSPGLSLEMPWLFREPLVFEQAEAQLEWQRDETGLRLRFPRLVVANPDGSASGQATMEIPADDSSPRLEAEAVVRDVAVAAGPRYLPVGIMSEKLVAWLDAALQAGHGDEAHVEFSGPTRKFPFRDGDGRFKAELNVRDAALAFAPGWPAATGIAATARFENEGLWAEIRDARLLDIQAGDARVAIPDLKEGELAIRGGAQGSLAGFRELVLAAEPLERLLGTALAPASISAGRASAELDLYLPLKDLADFRVGIDLEVEDGEVAYDFLGEPLRNIAASLRIDNAEVTGQHITASLAGDAIAAEVSVVEGGAVRVDGRSRMSAESLAAALRQPLSTYASGRSDWVGHVLFPAPDTGVPLEVGIGSNLEGMAIHLPEPFRKAAEEQRQLQLRATFTTPEFVDGEIAWGDVLRLSARLDRSGSGLRFAAVPGAAPALPPGMVIHGEIERLDLGEWLAVEFPRGDGVGGLADSIAGGRLLIAEFSAPMLQVRDLGVELARAEDHWIFDLASGRVAGRIDLPFHLYGREPVVARLDHLRLGVAANEPEDGEERAPVKLHPARIPPLDIEIGSLRAGGIRLGSISARILHEGDGIELIGLEGIGEGFMFQAEGRSRLSATVDESRLSLKVRSEDVGKTLSFMGFRRGMDSSDGRFDAEVAWQGGLRSDWLSAIAGSATIQIREGTLVGVEPGAGRVFGLLSLQALPRRLALDFKDVFGEGTSFDRISGDFRIRGGDAYTENLVMRGPAVDIGVIGRTGLVARDYEQTAVVGADLGRTLPVAGAVVGGPAVGAALYLLSEMLRKPFQAQMSYRLSGPWDNPVIERLSASGAGPLRPPPAEEESGQEEDRDE